MVTCLLFTLYLALVSHRFFYDITKKALPPDLPLLYTHSEPRGDHWIVTINPKVRPIPTTEPKQSLLPEPISFWDFRLWT